MARARRLTGQMHRYTLENKGMSIGSEELGARRTAGGIALAAVGCMGVAACLLIQRIHAYTFGRFSAWLLRQPFTRRVKGAAAPAFPTLLLGLAIVQRIEPPDPAHAALCILTTALLLAAIDCVVAALFEIPAELAPAEAAARANPLIKLMMRSLRDPRDATLVLFAMNLCFLAGGFSLFAVGTAGTGDTITLGLLGVSIWLRGAMPFVLLEHIDSHQKFLSPGKKQPPSVVLSILAFLHRYYVCMFLGLTPRWFDVAHVACHHRENNGPNDFLTTQPYDRTSFLDFGKYYARVFVTVFYGGLLYRYFRSTHRPARVRMLLHGMLCKGLLLTVAAAVAPSIAIWMLLSTIAIACNIAVTGWMDHALFEEHDPTNIVTNSYNQISWFDDHGFFGDAYHTQHHLTPAQWLGLDQRVAANKQIYAAGAMVLKDISLPADMLRALWKDDADFLYGFVASVGATKPSQEAFREIFRSRSRPSGWPAPGRFDRGLSRAAAALLLPPPQQPVASSLREQVG